MRLNQLGRQINNIALITGQPLRSGGTVAELKLQLETLGGRRLRPFMVEIPDSEIRGNAFTFGDRWNGWEMPIFNKEQALEIVKTIDGASYDDEDGEFWIPGNEDGELIAAESIMHDCTKYWIIGDSWVWEEVLLCPYCSEDPGDCECEFPEPNLELLEIRACCAEQVVVSAKELRFLINKTHTR